MKKYQIYVVILIVSIIVTNFSYSQNSYQVKYKMTTLFDGIKNYDAKLTFSELNSSFEYQLFSKDTTTVEREDNNGNKVISIPVKNQQAVYLNLKEKKITELKYFKSLYLVEDTLSFPQWIITEEMKNVNNYQCQKATAFYKGREYEVWYSNEYPTVFGPWKLNGLPGLIILAYDKKNEVIFEALEIQKTDVKTLPIKNSTKHISKDEFDNKIKNWQKDYEERLKSMGDRSLKFNVKFRKSVDLEILD